jgi:hypothetical protein
MNIIYLSSLTASEITPVIDHLVLISRPLYEVNWEQYTYHVTWWSFHNARRYIEKRWQPNKAERSEKAQACRKNGCSQ